MKAAKIIQAAKIEGLIVTLSHGGKIKATGELAAVNRWQPTLKEHKAEIVNLLTRQSNEAAVPTLPRWCRADCFFTEAVDLPGEGPVFGCVQQCYDFEQWRRLDKMNNYPSKLSALT